MVHIHLFVVSILFKPAAVFIHVIESRFPRTQTTPTLNNSNHHTPFRGHSIDLSVDSMAKLRKQLEVEEKIVAAARRMAELPTGNRRERQKRKQSLQQLVVVIIVVVMCRQLVEPPNKGHKN